MMCELCGNLNAFELFVFQSHTERGGTFTSIQCIDIWDCNDNVERDMQDRQHKMATQGKPPSHGLVNESEYGDGYHAGYKNGQQEKGL